MKKFALSLLVIAASGAYVWQQSQNAPADGLLDSTTLTGGSGAVLQSLLPAETTSPIAAAATANPVATPAIKDAPHPAAAQRPAVATPFIAPTPEAIPISAASVAQPRQLARDLPVTITRAAMTVSQSAGYVDGTYTGPVTDAYYGPMQIQAIVAGGRLTGIKVLQYPSDRRTSQRINQQALPWLRDEVVQAQSANVDIISGATLTSQAFIRSIGGALSQAVGH